MKKTYNRPETQAILTSTATIIATSIAIKGEADAEDVTLGAHGQNIDWDEE